MTANARVQSVPHRQRLKPHASNTRASGSQMSGKGYGSRESVQAPLTLITAFGRLASSSTFGRSVQARVVRLAPGLLRQHDADSDRAPRPPPFGDDIGHRRIVRVDRLDDGDP